MNSRGVCNNNPLNIRRTADKWQGLSSVQSDGAFFQFVSPEYGFRAAFKIIKNNWMKCHTIHSIVSRWAPPTENNTASYIRVVSSHLGLPPQASLGEFDDNPVVVSLVRVMAYVETGYWYDVDIVLRGRNLL